VIGFLEVWTIYIPIWWPNMNIKISILICLASILANGLAYKITPHSTVPPEYEATTVLPPYTAPPPPTTKAPRPPYTKPPTTTVAPVTDLDVPTTTEINADRITILIGVQDLSGGVIDSFSLLAGTRVTLAEILSDAWTQLIAHVQCAAVMRLAYGSKVIINMGVTISQLISAEDLARGEAEFVLVAPRTILIEQTTNFFVLW